MSLNDVPSGERVHIGFFGCRNAGKSSLVNAFTGQELSIVSPVEGTTTDPVTKAMELLPMGPVLIIDTPGVDDEGELGRARIKKAEQVLDKTDVAILVADGSRGLMRADEELLSLFEKRGLPHLLVFNKEDIASAESAGPEKYRDAMYVSALKGTHIEELKERVAAMGQKESRRFLVGDLLERGDVAVLVVPIDHAAPKGRLILPQQQVIRDALDAGAIPVVCRDSELEMTLGELAQKPSLVITDSQAFEKVAALVGQDISLTSFSILMARYKGNLEDALRGADALDGLKDGDRVLICEGCTHHRQCDDIGTVKLPAWIRQYTGAQISFEHCSGGDFPGDLSPYALIVHCGACMLGPAQMASRYGAAAAAGVRITNYGIAIAKMKGILERSVACFNR